MDRGRRSDVDRDCSRCLGTRGPCSGESGRTGPRELFATKGPGMGPWLELSSSAAGAGGRGRSGAGWTRMGDEDRWTGRKPRADASQRNPVPESRTRRESHRNEQIALDCRPGWRDCPAIRAPGHPSRRASPELRGALSPGRAHHHHQADLQSGGTSASGRRPPIRADRRRDANAVGGRGGRRPHPSRGGDGFRGSPPGEAGFA